MGFFKNLMKQDNSELTQEERVKLDSILESRKEKEVFSEDIKIEEKQEIVVEKEKKQEIEIDEKKEEKHLKDEKLKKDKEEIKVSKKEEIKIEHKIQKTKEDKGDKLKQFVENLNLEEINMVRELLDSKEILLYQIYGQDTKSSKVSKQDNVKFETPIIKKEILELNVEEKITIDDLNKETLEVKDLKKIDTKNIEKENIKQESKKNNIEEKSISLNSKSIVEKITEIFGEENMFIKKGKNNKHELLKDRDITMIGIRNINGFDDGIIPLNQNTWFITKIKKLDELKYFKMINATTTEKELFFDDEKDPILLIYRYTGLLNSKEKFDFD